MAWRARVPYCLHPLSPQDDEMVTTDSPFCLSNILPVVAAWYLERSVDFGHDALALSLFSADIPTMAHYTLLCYTPIHASTDMAADDYVPLVLSSGGAGGGHSEGPSHFDSLHIAIMPRRRSVCGGVFSETIIFM